MNRKHAGCWALVTNSGFGRLVALRKSAPGLQEIETREAPARHLPSRDLVSDASGRDFNAAGPGGHSKTPRSDAHEQAEVQFAGAWVQQLESALARKEFAHLLLVADPRTLGRLRAAMSKDLQAAITAEMNRDLTRLSMKQLEPRLRELAGWPPEKRRLAT